MLTGCLASTTASNSRVPVPDMELELQEALDTLDNETVHAAIRKVYLVGQDLNEVLRKVFEGACTRHDDDTLDRIFDLDYESIPSLRPIKVNEIWPQTVKLSLAEGCECVLRCFLKKGLDPHHTFGEEGDVLMWAVRVKDSYTVMHLLRMGCDPQGVKVRYFPIMIWERVASVGHRDWRTLNRCMCFGNANLCFTSAEALRQVLKY
jgi:hypothetical protein